MRTGRDLGGALTTPVRSVESGEFVLEVWIEEGPAKDEHPLEVPKASASTSDATKGTSK